MNYKPHDKFIFSPLAFDLALDIGDFRVSLSKLVFFPPSRLKFELVCLFSLPVKFTLVNLSFCLLLAPAFPTIEKWSRLLTLVLLEALWAHLSE